MYSKAVRNVGQRKRIDKGHYAQLVAFLPMRYADARRRRRSKAISIRRAQHWVVLIRIGQAVHLKQRRDVGQAVSVEVSSADTPADWILLVVQTEIPSRARSTSAIRVFGN
jgi:hypothetical protein